MHNQSLISAAEEHERDMAAHLEAKRQLAESGKFTEGLQRERAALDEIGRQIAALRQERESAASATESSTRLRMKKQDLQVGSSRAPSAAPTGLQLRAIVA